MIKRSTYSFLVGVVGILAGGSVPVFAQADAYEGEFNPRSQATNARVLAAPALVYSKSAAKPNPTPINQHSTTAGSVAKRAPMPVVKLASHDVQSDVITFDSDVTSSDASVEEVSPNSSLLFSEPDDLTVRPGITGELTTSEYDYADGDSRLVAPQTSVFAVPADQDAGLIDRAAAMRQADNNAPVYYTTQYAQPQQRTSYGHQFPSAMGSQPTQFAQPVSGTRVIIHYEHGHARHHCSSHCSYYKSRHYSHGHSRHLCDDHCSHHRSHSYAHGHQKHLCDSRCDHYHSRRYSHGHSRHLCDLHCSHYRSARYGHGHSRHLCGSHCSSYFSISFGHGHARHLCGSHCSHYFSRSYSHGHSRHLCDSHCSHHRSRRYSHGHSRHHCDSACSHFRVRVRSGSSHYSHGSSHYHHDSRRAQYRGGYRSPIYRHDSHHDSYSHSSSSFRFGRHGKNSSFHFGIRVGD